MTAPRHRSRHQRRVKVVTPGGRTVTHYRPFKHNKAQCGMCGTALQATVTGGKTQMRQLAKSERRPQRPYGGVLCVKCSRATIKAKAKLLG